MPAATGDGGGESTCRDAKADWCGREVDSGVASKPFASARGLSLQHPTQAQMVQSALIRRQNCVCFERSIPVNSSKRTVDPLLGRKRLFWLLAFLLAVVLRFHCRPLCFLRPGRHGCLQGLTVETTVAKKTKHQYVQPTIVLRGQRCFESMATHASALRHEMGSPKPSRNLPSHLACMRLSNPRAPALRRQYALRRSTGQAAASGI